MGDTPADAATVPGWARQDGHAVRFDWGPSGLRALGPASDVVVVVDVLRFTTCVQVAVERGAEVFPYRWKDANEADFAASVGAELAGDRWSLSPSGLRGIPAGTRLVLPSPNGSALSCSARQDHGAEVMAACLRNATAVGNAVVERLDRLGAGGTVAVIAAGERWREGGTGPLRPAVEDLWGAGAVIAAVLDVRGPDVASPEAASAAAAWRSVVDPPVALLACASGCELVGRGLGDDVVLAGDVDSGTTVPVLVDRAFRSVTGGVGELGP